ncbi:MAG TPA: glycosyltransferase family 2 protein [Acidimicrobiales bacterium]|nr:glycosyltransferase family 2 protein [Acidimicrobiales bacterium]
MTVGVPVRNGGGLLPAALRTLLDQSLDELEIVISDNGSTDDTPAVAAAFAAEDARVRYVRHDPPLTVWENFRFLVDEARGEYFMWAAHDDARNETYVERLVQALGDHPDAVLAYGDVVWFSDPEDRASNPRVTYDFNWDGHSYYRKLRKVLLSKCSEIYGVFRTEALRRYSWITTDYGVDIPLLLHMRVLGDFVHADGATIYEWRPETDKEPDERARQNFYRPLRPFRVARLAWVCMTAAAEAATRGGEPPRRVRTLAYGYLILRADRTKIWLYPRLPQPIRRAWRRYKPVPTAFPAAARLTAQEGPAS